MMSKTKLTTVDCIFFTKGMLYLLKENGFHVSSAQEAFVCFKNVLEAQVASDVHQSMEELKCPNCHPIFGMKSIDRIN